MMLQKVLALVVCTAVVGLCGCAGSSDDAPSPEEKAEMDAAMQQDMQNMEQMLPQNPTQATPPAGTDTSTP